MISIELKSEVKAELVRKNMKQKDLALILGTTPQRLSNVLNHIESSKPLEEKIEKWLEDQKKEN